MSVALWAVSTSARSAPSDARQLEEAQAPGRLQARFKALTHAALLVVLVLSPTYQIFTRRNCQIVDRR
jgi:hypothetical protein